MTIKQMALAVTFVAGVTGFAFNVPAYADNGNGCLTVDCEEYSGHHGDRCNYYPNACYCAFEPTCYCSTGEYPPC